MQLRQLEDAEEFLQLGARWSQEPIDQMTSLNNLGALHWLKEASIDPRVGPAVSSYRQQWRHRQFLSTSSTALTDQNNNNKDNMIIDEASRDARANLFAREALGYWDEAISLADKNIDQQEVFINFEMSH